MGLAGWIGISQRLASVARWQRALGFACVAALVVSACLVPAYAQVASYPCLIEPAETVKLSAPVDGVLKKATVKRGDRVKRGQLLAVLDSRVHKAAAQLALYKSRRKGPVEKAQAKIKFAKRKFKRLQGMAAAHLAPAQKRDDAEAALRQAQAELVEAKENLHIAHLQYKRDEREIAQRRIYSPFDGVVVSQSAWPGDVVQPSDVKHPIFTLAKVDPLTVKVILPMEAFGLPQVGMQARVEPEIKSVGPLTAQVSTVDRIINAASGSFEAFLTLANPDSDIPSGIKCTATFLPSGKTRTKDTKQAVRLPSASSKAN